MKKSDFARTLKLACRFNKYVRLITNHPDGDVYDGYVLACNREMVLLQNEDDFVFDGIIAFPLRSIKRIRTGALEKVRNEICVQFGLRKKINKSLWLLKVNNLQQIIDECGRRNIWPTIEAKTKGATGLYIGPITRANQSEFGIYVYDALGKWEGGYRLPYKEVLKIELFDSYSSNFNRYMRKKMRGRRKPRYVELSKDEK